MQRAFNQDGMDDPFGIPFAKGVTQTSRTLGPSFLLPAYEIANQLNRVTDDDPNTKFNFKPYEGQTFGGVAGRAALNAATGGLIGPLSALLNQLGIENKLAPQYGWTEKAKQDATKNSLLDQQEREAFVEDPINETNRATGQVALGMISAGANNAIKGMSLIPRVANRFAMSSAQGILGADKNKGQDPLLGGLTSGVFGVVGGEVGDLLSGQNINYDKLKSTEDIKKLPKRQQSLLFKQVKTSGMMNTELSNEQNILSYLNNRDLTGKTPQNTLFKMQSEIDKQKANKLGAIKDSPRVSTQYIDPVKEAALDQLSKENGMSKKAVLKTKAWTEISDWLEEGNFEAESIDAAVSKWQKNARTMSGDVKSPNNATVYSVFANAMKDTLRGKSPVSGNIAEKIPAVGDYDEAVSKLNDLKGFEDQFSKAIQSSSKKSANTGVNVRAGITGPKINTSRLGQFLTGAKTDVANAFETGLSGSPASQLLGTLAPQIGARTGDAITPSVGNVENPVSSTNPMQSSQSMEPAQGGQSGLGGMQQGVPFGQEQNGQEQSGNAFSNLINQQFSQQQAPKYDIEKLQGDLMNRVLSGSMSQSEAQYIIEQVQQMNGGQDITTQINQLAQTDPGQASALLGQALLSGTIDPATANAYSKLLGLDGSGDSDYNDQLVRAVDQLDKLYNYDTNGEEDSISLGKKSAGISGLYNKANTLGKTSFNQDFNDRIKAYEQMRSAAAGIINKAGEAGVLNAGEYERMMLNMPDQYTTKTVADQWFRDIKSMLAGDLALGGSTDTTQDQYDAWMR